MWIVLSGNKSYFFDALPIEDEYEIFGALRSRWLLLWKKIFLHMNASILWKIWFFRMISHDLESQYEWIKSSEVTWSSIYHRKMHFNCAVSFDCSRCIHAECWYENEKKVSSSNPIRNNKFHEFAAAKKSTTETTFNHKFNSRRQRAFSAREKVAFMCTNSIYRCNGIKIASFQFCVGANERIKLFGSCWVDARACLATFRVSFIWKMFAKTNSLLRICWFIKWMWFMVKTRFSLHSLFVCTLLRQTQPFVMAYAKTKRAQFLVFICGFVCLWFNISYLNIFTLITRAKRAIKMPVVFITTDAMLIVDGFAVVCITIKNLQFLVHKCHNFPFQLFVPHSFCRTQTSTKCYLVYWRLAYTPLSRCTLFSPSLFLQSNLFSAKAWALEIYLYVRLELALSPTPHPTCLSCLFEAFLQECSNFFFLLRSQFGGFFCVCL